MRLSNWLSLFSSRVRSRRASRLNRHGLERLEDRVLLSAVDAGAAPFKQIITPSQSEFSLQQSEQFSFDINYSTTPLDNTLSGISFRMHFDSSQLQLVGTTNVLNNGFDIAGVGGVQSDSSNFDNDTDTDSFVLFNFVDNDLQFPGEMLPSTLATVTFSTANNFAMSSLVNFSERETAITDAQTDFYAFEAGCVSVTERELAVDIVDGSLDPTDSSSLVTFDFSGNVTGFDASDVTVSGGVLSNFAGAGSSFSAVFTADDEFAGTGTVSVGAGSYTNSDNAPGSAGSDTVPIDTIGASPEFAFNFDAIASDIHPTLRYFGSPNADDAPFQIIRFGEITLSSLTGLPATLAAAGNDPANIVIRVGSNDASNLVEVISLNSFNDGLSSGTVNQTYRPNGSLAPGGTQTDVPTATVFVSGVAVAEGVFQELSLDGNMSGQILSSSTGRILLERALGDDTTVFDEIVAKNGSGQIEFALNPFFFGGTATGFGDSAEFTSTGASPDGDPNQAPSVGTNSPLVVLEGASETITTAQLNEADPDDSGFGVTYTVTSGPSSGTLNLSGSPTTVFTQADIDAGRVTYQHDGTNGTADSFAFSLADGGEDGVQPATGTFSFSISATNDAPTAVALANTVTTLSEDANTATRTKIADVVVTDDGLGTNTLSLSGTDAALFEIDGTELFLVAGAGLDFEANPALDVTVSVDDVTVGNTPDATVNHTVTITGVNDPPTAVVLQNPETTLAEDANTAARTKIADIVVTDDTLGTNTLSVSGADAALFEIIGSELFLIAGAGLDFETNPVLDVTVSVDDVTVGATPDATVNHAIAITDVNEAPTAVALENVVSLAEDADTTARTKIGDIVVTDDALGTNELSLSGADATLFEIDGTELFLVAGAALDFETTPVLNLTLSVDDLTVGNTPDATSDFSVTITDVNEAPTAVALANVVTTLAEDANTTARTKIADIVVTDDALGTNDLSVSGIDAALFEIDGTELFLVAGAALDFETNSILNVTVSVDDLTVGTTPDATVSQTVTITDANDAPTAVALENVVTTLAEDANTSTRTKIADIVVTDDALGTNSLSVSGDDQALFEIDGSELFLIAGAALDFETNSTLDVTVSVDDLTVGATPDATASHAVTITDVNETPDLVITPSTTITVAEGVSNVAGVTGQDPDIDDVVTVSITGGADSGLFELTPANPLTGTDPVTGTLAFTTPPTFNEGGDNDYEVILAITDDGGLTGDSLTVNITVVQFGIVPPTSAVVFENQNDAIDLDAVVTQGDSPEFSIVDNGTADDGQLFDVDPATGVVTFKATPDFESPAAVGGGNAYQFTAKVVDQTVTEGAEQPITITVENVDEAPVFTIATPAHSSDEDPIPALVTVPGFATGIDAIDAGQTGSLDFVFSPNGTTGGLTFTQAPDIDADGILTYQATADSNGTATYDVVLTDNGSLDNGGANQSSPPVSVTITVNAVNDAPVIDPVEDPASVNEDNQVGPITVTLSDVDTDLSNVTLAGMSDNQSLVLNSNILITGTGATRMVTVTPELNQSGTATITLTANDGAADSAAESFTVTVNAVNDPPIVSTNIGLSLRELETRTISMSQLETTDVDDGPADLTYSVSTLPTGGNLLLDGVIQAAAFTFTQQDIDDEKLSYQHANEEVLTDSFTFTVADGGEDGVSPVGPVQFDIRVLTILSEISDQTFGTDLGVVTIPVAAAIIDGDVPVLSTENLPSYASFASTGPGTGLFTFDPTSGDEGADEIRLNATTMDGTDFITFTANVVTGPTNVSNETTNFVNVGGPAITTRSITGDTGSGSSPIRNVGRTFSTTATINTGNASIPAGTPASIFQTLRYDVAGGPEMQFSFPVNPGEYRVNLYFSEIYRPTFQTGARVFDVAIEGNLEFDNVDVFSEVGGNAGLVKTVDVTADSSLDIAFLHQTENPIVSAIEIINLNLVPSQSAPSLSEIGNRQASEGQTLTIDFQAPDAEGDDVILTVSDLPSERFQFTDNGNGTGRLTVNAIEGDAGEYPITITATQQNGVSLTDTESFVVSVLATNDPPQLDTNTPLTLMEGATAIIGSNLLSGSDPDDANESLTYSLTALPQRGTLQLDGADLTTASTFSQADVTANRIQYVHDGGESTSDSFLFSLADGGEDGAAPVSGRFDINITPVNDAPRIDRSNDLTVRAGGTRGITVSQLSGSDSDDVPANLTYTFTGPGEGNILVNGTPASMFTQQDVIDGKVEYENTNDQATSDSFTVTLADDDNATSDPATINVTISNVTILAPIPTQTIAAETGPVDIPVAAAGVEGVTAALTVTGLPAFASFTDNGDGTGLFAFDPESGDVGSSTIDLTATAGDVVETVSFTLDVVTVPTEQANETIHFVNVGGPAIPAAMISGDSASLRNTGSEYSTGAAINLGDSSIPDGTPGSLFQTLRYDVASGAEMNYSFPVDPGNYQVRLYFAETYGPAFQTGARVFDVAAEGVLAIDNLDVFSEVGGNAGLVKTISSVTADSTLDITFLHQVENPIVSAIEIINLNQVPAQTAPVLDRIGNLSVNEGQTFTFRFAKPDTATAAFAPQLPPFVTLSDPDINGFVTATVSPNEGDAGQYPINGTVTQNGLTDSESIVLTVVGVNEPPQLTINNPLTVDEGANGIIDSSLLNSFDPDDASSELSFSFTVASGPVHGGLFRDGTALSEGGMFTQADINNDLIEYRHDGSEDSSDSFDFMLADGGENDTPAVPGTFRINISPINDAPTLDVNSGITLREGTTRTITAAALSGSDVDNPSTDLVYTVTSPVPAAGTLRVDGAVASSFTQQQVNDGKVTYTQDGTVAASDSFGFNFTDGAAPAISGTVNISITADPAFELNVNAGGPAVGGFVPDTGIQNGAGTRFDTRASIDVSDPAVAGVPASVFQTVLYDRAGGADLSFDVAVEAGVTVEVTLYFSEIYGPASSTGARVFDVSIDGSLKLDNFDIFGAAGAGNTAVARSFQVTSDGNVDIDLGRVTENPAIAGFRIREIDDVFSNSQNVPGM